MDFEQYKDVIKDFYESTGIDPPPAAAIDAWFFHLQSVDLTVLSGALKKMKTELERRPYNMLFKIKEFIKIYLIENPQVRKKIKDEPCEDCRGEGVFFVRYKATDGSDRMNSALILCGACENWRKIYSSLDGKLRMKLFEAEYKGYEVQK